MLLSTMPTTIRPSPGGGESEGCAWRGGGWGGGSGAASPVQSAGFSADGGSVQFAEPDAHDACGASAAGAAAGAAAAGSASPPSQAASRASASVSARPAGGGTGAPRGANTVASSGGFGGRSRSSSPLIDRA